MDSLPLVSVIMPVRDEAAYIEHSLGSVLTQDYPVDRLEILVVDGMSIDGTREYVTATQATRPNLRLLDNPQGIVSPGLNIGIAEARGDIIVRVDGHCEIAPDYVRRCVEHLLADDAEAVGGPIETIGETDEAQAIALAMSSWFGVGGSAFRTINDRPMLVETVAFPAYRRVTLERLGPFDEQLVRNQDDEYNYRLLKSGGRILLSPDIRSRYYSRGSLRKLWRQYYQYGFWKVRVMQKHPRQMRWRQFVPPAFVASMIGSSIMGLFLRPFRLLGALIAGLYLAANLLASLSLGREYGRGYIPRLLIIHPILHLSYGLGFLAGLFNFSRLRRPETLPDKEPRSPAG
ncbi:MAG: glycosyltransferase family 2 protein [Candidatus Promineofilum sp.]|nr:glycosyltransferase family 2 protein [Promineifilum sp.]MBP9657433.1 glycosyltransferase family 2 protein [Promineifilum sp.]